MKLTSSSYPSSGPFWIYGLHAVKAALNNPIRSCLKLFYLSDSILKDLPRSVKCPNLCPQKVEKTDFAKIFPSDAVHQGIALLIQPLPSLALEDLCQQTASHFMIATLDQVTDPYNLGAIARSAAVFGLKALLLPERNTPPLTSPVVYKTASGALEHLALIHVTNLSRALNQLKMAGFWNIGCDETGQKSISDTDLKGRLNLILGSEGQGMRRLTKESCDLLVRLPTSDTFQTLNVSTAASIAFYEAARQQKGLK